MRTWCTFLLAGLWAFAAQAQTRITSTVQADNGRPVDAATVSLLRAADSSAVKHTLSDASGRFGFDNARPGSYLLSVTAVGYRKVFSAPFSIAEDQAAHALPAITVQAQSKELQEVAVRAEKPLIERHLDKLIVNVQNSITSAGSSALEVLERAPGVLVDQNDNISLKGKSGVIIQIDGKPSNISGQDLANMLRGLSSDQIDRLEIISNPSSRYDAAGNAGIINIRLKKDQRLGTNGSFTTAAGQGMKFRTSQSLSLNNRNKKLNTFGTYSFSSRTSYAGLDIVRRFYNAGVITSGFNQHSEMNFPVTNHTARIGFDYSPTQKTMIGMVLNGISNRLRRETLNDAIQLDQNEAPVALLNTSNRSVQKLGHFSPNLNFRHTFDSLGRELSADLDYASYRTTMDPRLATRFSNPAGAVTQNPYYLSGDLLGKLSIYSVKADYTHPFSKKMKMEAGFKNSWVRSDNDLVFYEQQNGPPQYDPTKSNHFIYRENINAAYLNLSRNLGKLDLQLGLRAEQTNARGRQVVNNQAFSNSYFNLFPSAFISYKLSDKDQLGLSVSRRLNRPTYNQLNPFKYYIDPTSYNEGNPFLKPAYSLAWELNYTRRQLNVTLSYSRTNDVIMGVIHPVHTAGQSSSVETTINLAEFDYYGFSFTSPLKLAKWWNTQTNWISWYGRYRGYFSGTPVNNGNPVFNINHSHSLTIGKGWSAEMTAYYRSRETYAYLVSRSVFRMGAGVQKNLLGNKGTLRLNVTDIFRTDYPRVTSTFSTYQQYFESLRDTRVANLSFSYRFGKNTVQASRRRTSGAEEEKGRAN